MACWRRSRGLPALTVSWGPWSATGMSAQVSSSTRNRWAEKGIKPFSAEESTALLRKLLGSEIPHLAAVQVEWLQFVDELGNAARPSLLKSFVSAPPPSKPAVRAFVDMEPLSGAALILRMNAYLRERLSTI